MTKELKVSANAITDLCDEPEAVRIERETREREERNAKIETEYSGIVQSIEKNEGGYWVTVKHEGVEYGSQCKVEGSVPKKGDRVTFTRMPKGEDRATLIIRNS